MLEGAKKMTKEDMTMCDAVRRGIDKRIGRGTVVRVWPGGNLTQVTLHGNTIAIFRKYAKFSTCGFSTATTCRKLNALMTLVPDASGYVVLVYHRAATLFLCGKPVMDVSHGQEFSEQDFRAIRGKMCHD